MKNKVFVKMASVVVAISIIGCLAVSCTTKGDDVQQTTAAVTGKTTLAASLSTSAKNTSPTAAKSAATVAAVSVSASQTANVGAVSEEGLGGDEGQEEQQEEVSDGNNDKDVQETAIDLGGRELVIGLQFALRVPTPADPVEARKLLYESGVRMEEKYNCKIKYEVTAVGYLNDMKTRLLAGVENRDLVATQDAWIAPDLVEGGYFLKLDEFILNDTDVWKDLIEGFAPWKGHYYGFTEQGNKAGYARVLVYDRMIMDRTGENIWKYVEDGIWNWDTFVQVAKAATQDYNGDGIVDQWGLSAAEATLGECLVYSNGGSMIEEAGGTFIYTLNSPKAAKALQFMSDLYNVYKVTHPSGASWLTHMKNNIAAMTMCAGGSYATSYFTDEAIAANKIIAPVPKGPDKNTYITGIATYFEMFSFPSNIKEPDKVVTVLMDLFYDRYINLNKESDSLKSMADSWFRTNLENVGLFMRMRELGGPFVKTNINTFAPLATEVTNRIYKQIIKLEMPVSTALTSTEGMMQDIIAKVLE